MIYFYLGGARSGKSQLAEQHLLQFEQTGKQVCYIATARPSQSMQCRIELHQQRRPNHWQIIEEPLALASLLQQASRDQVVMIDCLTLWLTNHLLSTAAESPTLQERELTAQITQLAQAFTQCQAQLIVVSNEVGHGLVPPDPLSQLFAQKAGELHQVIASQATEVYWCHVGIASALKWGKRCEL